MLSRPAENGIEVALKRCYFIRGRRNGAVISAHNGEKDGRL